MAAKCCLDDSYTERLQEDLADFKENYCQFLYQNRLDGPVRCHVLVHFFRFVKEFLLDIGQVFPTYTSTTADR